MPHSGLLCRPAATFVLVGLVTGCGTSSVEPTNAETASTGQTHTHDHAHQHGETGPNGGHLVELNGGEYHAEWLHDDESSTVTVILLDDKPEQEIAIDAEHVTIEVAAGGKRESYELKATALTGDVDVPQASRFELASPNLLVGLKMGEGVDVSLTVEIGDKKYVGTIEHQPHDEHDHHHH